MLNTNENDRRKQAAKDYAAKLALELTLYKMIAPIFRRESLNFARSYSSVGLVPDLFQFKKEINGILQSHYVDVSNVFSKRIIDQLGKPEDYDRILDAMKNEIQLAANKRAAASAAVISDTTHDDMHDAIEKVTNDAMQEGRILSKSETAERAKLELDKKNAARLGTISATETQNPAEKAKQTEINMLHQNDAEFDGEKIVGKNIQKQWVAILDKVTRDAHADADGQIVDFDEPYIVMGQQLMVPGDMDLGATIDNVINCRCSSIKIIG